MKTAETIQLRASRDGDVLMPNGDLLLHQYEAGDWDKIAWPLTEEQKPQLASAIYAEIMCSDENYPEDSTVLLPDGHEFDLYKWLP
jgi:hypothetical protein